MNLQKLAFTSDSERDIQWEDHFLTALAEGEVAVMSPDPIEGPDGWSYLAVSTEVDQNTSEPTQKIIRWLSTRGIGLVVNPQKEAPDYVLSYGMLWSFCETGKFIQRHKIEDSRQATREQVVFSGKNLIEAGIPTEQFLPSYVRQVLRDFFRDQNVYQPRVLLLSSDKKNYDLSFSAESLGSPKESEWAGIGEAISWFLPAHYSILVISEKNLPDFINL